MKSSRSKWIAMSTLALVALAVAGIAHTQAQNVPQAAQTRGSVMATDSQWLLFVAPDESSVEQRIAEYLSGRMNWEAQTRYIGQGEEDLILIYDLPVDPARGPDSPTVRIILDTQPSATQNDQVSERVISMVCFLVLPDENKNPADLERVRKLNNQWLDSKWSPDRVFLDRDDDIRFETWINIPAVNTPIHAEMVYDAMARMRSAYIEYVQLLADEL